MAEAQPTEQQLDSYALNHAVELQRIREFLRLTPTQRLEHAVRAIRQLQVLQVAGAEARRRAREAHAAQS